MSRRLVSEGSTRGAVELRFRVDRSFGVSRDQGLLWLDAARYGDMRTMKAIADGVLKKGERESGHDHKVKREVGSGQHYDRAPRASESREHIDNEIVAAAFSKPALWRLAHYNGQGTSYGFIGSVALHWAAANGDIALCQMLLNHPYSTAVNCQNLGGSTPLHSACSNGRLAAAQLLLSYGANPLVADVCGDLPADVIPPPSVARMRSAESEELLQSYQNRRGGKQGDHHGIGVGRKGRKTKQQKGSSSDPLADLRMVMKGATMVSSLLEKYGLASLNYNTTNACHGTATTATTTTTSARCKSTLLGAAVGDCVAKWSMRELKLVADSLGAYVTQEERGEEEDSEDRGRAEEREDDVAGSLRGGAASAAAGSRGATIGGKLSSADAVGRSQQQLGLEKEDYVRLCRKIVERWMLLRRGGGRGSEGDTDGGDYCDDDDADNDTSAAQFLSSVQERHLLRLLKAEQMRHDRLQAKRLAGRTEAPYKDHSKANDGGGGATHGYKSDRDSDEDEDDEDAEEIRLLEVARKRSDTIKEKANALLRQPTAHSPASSLPDYKGAIKLYTSAISICPTNSVLYSNRAACFLGLVRQQEQQFGRSGGDANSLSSSSRTSLLTSAVRDCKSAMLLDVTYVKPIYRLAHALSLLGRHEEVRSLVEKTLARAKEGGQRSAAICSETSVPTMSDENITSNDSNSSSSFLSPLSLAQEDVDAFRSLLLPLAEDTHSGKVSEARSGATTKANADAAGIEASNDNDNDVAMSVLKDKTLSTSSSLSDHDDDNNDDDSSPSFVGDSSDDSYAMDVSFQQYMVRSCLSAKKIRGVHTKEQEEEESGDEKDSPLLQKEKKLATPFDALLTAATSTSTSSTYVNPAGRKPWFDCPLCENRTRDQVNTACCGKALCGTCLKRKTASALSSTNGSPKCPFCEERLS